MLELTALTGALSSVGALIKVANESKNVEMTSKLIDLQQKILDIQASFGDMQQKLFEVQQENREFQERQRGTDEDATFRASLVYDERQGIWTRKVSNIVEAYCGDCLNDGKRTRLSRGSSQYSCYLHGYR